MYQIIFYQNEKRVSEVENYIYELKRNKSKENKIKLNKIVAYLDLLAKMGFELSSIYIKHLKDEIWELRPLKDRILFAAFDNNKFILLSVFTKKTQKTPKREIEKAERLLKDYKRRNDVK